MTNPFDHLTILAAQRIVTVAIKVCPVVDDGSCKNKSYVEVGKALGEKSASKGVGCQPQRFPLSERIRLEMFEGNCGTICQNQGCSQKKMRKENTLEFCIKIFHLPKGYNWPDTLQKQGVVE